MSFIDKDDVQRRFARASANPRKQTESSHDDASPQLAGARILFAEEEDAAHVPVHAELQEMGHEVAWISPDKEGAAGVAFRPDLVILDAALSARGKHEFLDLLSASGYEGRLLFLEGGRHLRDAKKVAISSGLKRLGEIDRHYSREMVAAFLDELEPAEGGCEAGDRAFVSSLIQNRRLVPNITHEFLPKFSLKRNVIRGYEALTRLKNRRSLNPELIFSPSTVLPLEIAVTLLAVEAAARLIFAQTMGGPRVPVAVNCSLAVLGSPDFTSSVSALLQKHHASPEALIVEITDLEEDRVGENVTENMRKLRKMGVGFSVDDFGREDVNFDLLSELRISEIKMNAQCIRKYMDGSYDGFFIREVWSFCKKNKIRIVIKSIESDLDMDIGKTMGADFGQGFYWGRPMPPRVLTRYYPD